MMIRFRFTTRRLLLAVAILGLTFGVIASLRDRVTLANFDRIQLGMTEAQVRQLFGRGPDLQTPQIGEVMDPFTYSGVDVDMAAEGLHSKGFRDYLWRQWTGPEFSMIVIFDQAGRVVCRYNSAPPILTVSQPTKVQSRRTRPAPSTSARAVPPYRINDPVD